MTDVVSDEAGEPRAATLRYPVLVLGVFILTYVVVFGTLTWQHQSNYGTFGFDMGIYDQGIWLLSRFKEPFVTVRGLNYFAHHVNLITVVFVPFYWLGAGPHFLYLVQTVVMAAGAIPVYLLARDATNERLALVPAAVFLLYPAVEWTNWWHFHPDALITTPLLFAWWLASRTKWRWYAVAIVCALLAKEDAALAVTAMGVVLMLRGQRRWGIRTFAAGAVYYLVATRLIIPIANGGAQPFYAELYPDFGDSMPEILFNAIRHPSRVFELAFRFDRLEYYRALILPVALLSFLSPLPLLIGVPQLFANVLSIHPGTHDVHYHYTAVLTVAIFISFVESFARLAKLRRPWPVVMSVVLIAVVLVANRVDSPSPLGRNFASYSVWVRRPLPASKAVDAALRLVRPGDKVTATFYMVPHLSHRQYIYEFPNPFRAVNWGAHGENLADPGTVDTLVIDTNLTGNDTYLYKTLTGPSGAFRVVYSKNGIIVARRKAPLGLEQPAA